jgi:hypothetical protein
MLGTKLENYYKDIIPLKGSRFFHDIELKKNKLVAFQPIHSQMKKNLNGHN